jgi:hypothetical protein
VVPLKSYAIPARSHVDRWGTIHREPLALSSVVRHDEPSAPQPRMRTCTLGCMQHVDALSKNEGEAKLNAIAKWIDGNIDHARALCEAHGEVPDAAHSEATVGSCSKRFRAPANSNAPRDGAHLHTADVIRLFTMNRARRDRCAQLSYAFDQRLRGPAGWRGDDLRSPRNRHRGTRGCHGSSSGWLSGDNRTDALRQRRSTLPRLHSLASNSVSPATTTEWLTAMVSRSRRSRNPRMTPRSQWAQRQTAPRSAAPTGVAQNSGGICYHRS